MLSSSLVESPVRCVVHTVHGTPTPAEMILAVHHTLQHGEVPVLWDIRDLDPNADFTPYEQQLRNLIRSSSPVLSSRRRAFLVGTDQRPALEPFLSRLAFSGSWAVFDTYDAALRWLQE